MKLTKKYNRFNFSYRDFTVNFQWLEFNADITSVFFVGEDGRIVATIANEEVYIFLSQNWTGKKDVYTDEGDLKCIFKGFD